MKISLKNLFSLLGILVLISISCTNEIDTPPCLKGTVRFTNLSEHPYELYIDNAFEKTVFGGTFHEVNVLEGTHKADVIQKSGYILFPTELSTSIFVVGCQESEWVFPY